MTRKGEKREAAWFTIRSQKGTAFTVRDIYMFGPFERRDMDNVREYMNALVKSGHLTREGDKPAFYRLARDTGAEAPRVRADGTAATRGRGREQMWRTMRILRDFTPRELAATASTEEFPVAESEAAYYARRLRAAGYLKLMSPGKPGHRRGTGEQARYALIRACWTGPRPPRTRRDGTVYDPNAKGER